MLLRNEITRRVGNRIEKEFALRAAFVLPNTRPAAGDMIIEPYGNYSYFGYFYLFLPKLPVVPEEMLISMVLNDGTGSDVYYNTSHGSFDGIGLYSRGISKNPFIENISIIENAAISITFSEPMNTAAGLVGIISVYDVITLTNPVWSGDGRTVTYNFDFSQLPTAWNKLNIADFQDLSGDEMLGYSLSMLLEMYSLQVDLGGGEGGTVSGNVARNTTIPIDAGTKTGFSFSHWTSDIGSNRGTFGNANSPVTTFTMPSNNAHITAHWTRNSYRLTVDGGGVGGTGNGSHLYEATVSLQAGVKDGYAFSHWSSEDGVVFDDAASPATTFAMPGHDVTVKANWTPYPFRLTIEGGGEGSATSGGEYDCGSTVAIHAGTKPGYRFKNWTSSDGIVFADAYNPTTTFTMPPHDVTITANWERRPAPLPDPEPSSPVPAAEDTFIFTPTLIDEMLELQQNIQI